MICPACRMRESELGLGASCYHCTNENLISHLIRQIKESRMSDENWERFDEMIVAAINHSRVKSGLAEIPVEKG